VHAVTRVPRLGLAVLALQAVAAAAFAAWLLLAQDPRLPWRDHVDVRVELRDASGLRTGSRAQVTVAGVPAGNVERVRHQDGLAIADVRLDPEVAGRVRRGARATVQARSALNDLVLDLTAGDLRAPPLRDGDVLRAGATRGTVAFDEVLDALDVDARAALQVLVAELDRGTRDLGAARPRGARAAKVAVRGTATSPGAVAPRGGRAAGAGVARTATSPGAAAPRGGRLRAALAQLDPVTASGAGVARRLAARRAELVRLTGALERLGGALAREAPAVAGVLRRGRVTLDALARRESALRSTVGELAPALDGVRRGARATRALGTELDPALRALRPAVRELPAALRELRAAVPAARGLVGRLDRTGREARGPVRRLRSILGRVGPTATALQPTTARLAPVLRAVDRHRDGIGLLGDRFSGIFSTSDVNGVVLRGLGFFEPFDPAGFGAPGATGARRAALAVQASRALAQVCRERNELACLVRHLVPGLPVPGRSGRRP
jgi:phospholipid/cholesterol/gamma-HCH transport system substrate-binding protein